MPKGTNNTISKQTSEQLPRQNKASTKTLSKFSGDFALLSNLDVAIDICYAKSKRSFELVSILPKVLVKPSFNNIDYPHNVSLLIDTGASFSCMTQSLFDRLRLSIGIRHESRQRPAPIAANGMSLKCIGETVFDIKLSQNKNSAKISNIRFSIFKNLSSDLILGWEVIKSLNLQIKDQGTTLGLDNINIPLGQGELRHGESQNLVTTLPQEAAIVKERSSDVNTTTPGSELSSGPFLWAPMTCSYTYKNGSSTVPILVSLTDDELQVAPEINMLNNCDGISSEEDSSVRAQTELTQAEIVCSGNWDLTNITSPVVRDKRSLIEKGFVDECTSCSDISEPGKRILKSILLKFREIFSANEFDVGLYDDETFSVSLNDQNELPPYVKPRVIGLGAEKFVSDHMKDMISKKIFEPCPQGNPTNSPCHIVTTMKGDKKSFRFCIDYSILNKYIKPNAFPLPRISEVFSKLEGSKFFTSLDLRKGFWNLKIDEKSSNLLSFSVGTRQYRPLRLPMGLKISPGLFQKVMIDIVADYVDKFVVVYIDDCLIFSKTETDHLEHIKLVLEQFKKSGILLNHTKCQFGKNKLEYLGFEISHKGYRPRPDKVLAIRNFPTPKNTTQVKRFIGCVSFLTKCIPSLQYYLDPLHSISGRKSNFKWTDVQKECFNKIKKMVENSCMMAFPSTDRRRTLYLTTDASALGFGSMLSQLQPDGSEKPLGFYSSKFKGAEINYEIRVKEMLAFYKSLDFFHDFIYFRNFVWRTDNRALLYYQNNLNNKSVRKDNKILRWLDFINQHSFAIELHSGKSDILAIPDALSRQYEGSPTTISELATIDITKFWINSTCSLDEFIKHQQNDENLNNFVNKNKCPSWASIGKNFKIINENNLLRGKLASGLIVTLVPESLEQQLIEFYHLPMHKNLKNILRELKQHFIFPKMRAKVLRFIKECRECVAFKPDRSMKLTENKTSTPNHPWQQLQMDLIGPIGQTDRGNRYILTVVDCLTRYTFLTPIPTKEGKCVLQALKNIFAQYGPPLSIQSDNGREFVNDSLKTFFELMNIAFKTSTPHRPQSQGMVERTNQKVVKFLKMFKSQDHSWDDDIPLVTFAINMELNRHTGYTPFQLFHGWSILTPSFLTKDSTLLTNMNDLRNVNYNIANAVAKHRRTLTQVFVGDETRKAKTATRRKIDPLTVGTKVLFRFQRPIGSTKLFEEWKGLYNIKKVLDNDAYLINSDDDPRKEYVAFRPRLKVFGIPVKARSGMAENNKGSLKEENEVKTSAKSNISEPPSEAETTPKNYNLRQNRNNDYRKFYA